MKLDNFKESWLNIVFENKNKSYGAFELRKETSKTTLIGLIIGSVAFAGVLLTVLYFTVMKGSNNEQITDVKLTKLDIPKNIPPPPPPPKTPPPPPKPKVDQVKFVKPKAVKKEEADEDPPKQKQFEKEKPAATTEKGDKDGDDNQFVEHGKADVVTKSEEVDPNQIFTSVEVQAGFPGGPSKFGDFVRNNFRVPDDMDSQQKVLVKFVVEKDGSLTDITILRDPGFGLGDEAKKALKRCPKWKPAIMNGVSVRSYFTLPITIAPSAE